MALTTLILDAPGPPLLFEEVDRFLELGLAVTLNLHYFADRARIRQHYGTRIDYTEINCHDEPGFIAAVNRAGGYSVFKTRLNIPIGASLIRAATSPALATPLRAIAQAGAGVNHIDRRECEQCGVTILNTPGSNAIAVAEYVLAQALFLSRDLDDYNAQTHNGHWAKGTLAPAPEYAELTLGLVGTGNIARQVARKAAALGIKVIATGSERFTEPVAHSLGLERRADLAQLLAEADIVSIHIPLIPLTRGLFGAAEFRQMRQGSILINTARGGIVDEHQLADFMRQFPRHIKAVAIDTFALERDRFDSPLIDIPNAQLTPHIAGNTTTAIRMASRQIVDQIHAFGAGVMVR
ncbi:D-3-phosphoglycerate dehydrogenase [Pseudomonas orientalis]|uniref:NAD(P)-dependent oxidoreductase n=1 Tax=Pseudomonas orientalis TaxID=76758 RepID=UPI000F585B20|nr:NAD(P)-dependent oxidoreductase [Pseudomonas orientalis]AZE84083.1 D-3-phosphoglycerate dehydrogenase [Pseudomonas orientalis]